MSMKILSDILKWTVISTRWQQQKLCMVFKISKVDVPEYMLNYFEKVKNLHNHNTWIAVSGGYTLPKINNDSGKRTFHYSGAQSWNKLPTYIQKSQNKNSLKTECVKYQISVMHIYMFSVIWECMVGYK